METQELQIIGALYNAIREWLEKYSTDWLSRSQEFKSFYQAVKHQLKIVQLLSDTQRIPPLTVKEKVANAVFYVDGDITYRVIYNMIEEGYFCIINEDDGEEYDIHYDSVPADAYFLGTIKL